MSDQLSMFEPTISADTGNAISSQASASGATPCASPDGVTSAPPGPEAAPASPSPQPGRVKRMKMIDTLRRSGYGSSESAALQSSLENKLARRLESVGSTLFSLKWSKCTTPAGRLISRLAASGRRTSGSDCSSLPTPLVNDELGSTHCYGKKVEGQERKRFWKLPGAAQLATWATPAARDWRSNDASEEHHAARREQTRGKPLSEQTHQLTAVTLLATWATPRHTDAKCGGTYTDKCEGKDLAKDANLVQLTASGATPTGSPASTEKRGQLNPAHSRWLMGLPPAWDACAPTETRSTLNKLRSSSGRTGK